MAEKNGCSLFLVYRNPRSWEIEHEWAGRTGKNGIKAGVWYMLDKTGKPIECS